MSHTRALPPSFQPLESRLFLDAVFGSFGGGTSFSGGFKAGFSINDSDDFFFVSFSSPGFFSNPAFPTMTFPSLVLPSPITPGFNPAGPIPDPIGSVSPFGQTPTARPTASILTPDPGNTFRVGQTITFRGSAVSSSGTTVPAGSFLWRVTLHDRGTSRQIIQPIRGVTTGTFTVPRLGRLTANAFLRLSLTVTDITGLTDSVTLDLPRARPAGSTGERPVANINSPGVGTTFAAGQRLAFDGFGFDTQDQFLPDASHTWRFALHSGGRTRGLIQPVVGQKSGSIVIPSDLPNLTADDFLRVSLSVRDSDGNTSRSFVDLAPANPGTGGGGGGGGDEDAPRSQILFPDDGTPFSPGDEVRFSGTAVDPQDGAVPRGRFVWRAQLRDGNTRTPIIDPIRGVKTGAFDIPENLRNFSDDAVIRLSLTTRDSDGNSAATSVDLPLDNNNNGGGDNANAPDVQLFFPADNDTFAVGDTIDFSGAATDTEDGVLNADRFLWRVTLENGQNSRRLRTIRGVRSGSFTVPDSLGPDPSQSLRFTLVVTDSGGRSTRESVDVQARSSRLRFNSNFPEVNLAATLDGNRRNLPFESNTLVGATRTISVPQTQTVNGLVYEFRRWSDDRNRTHDVRATEQDRTLTAIYRIVGTADSLAAGRTPFSSIRIPSNGVLNDPAADREIIR